MPVSSFHLSLASVVTSVKQLKNLHYRFRGAFHFPLAFLSFTFLFLCLSWASSCNNRCRIISNGNGWRGRASPLNWIPLLSCGRHVPAQPMNQYWGWVRDCGATPSLLLLSSSSPTTAVGLIMVVKEAVVEQHQYSSCCVYVEDQKTRECRPTLVCGKYENHSTLRSRAATLISTPFVVVSSSCSSTSLGLWVVVGGANESSSSQAI